MIQTGIAVLVINMSKYTTFEVSVEDDAKIYKYDLEGHANAYEREEYHLTPKDGNILSDVLLLNGVALKLTGASGIPAMEPRVVDASLPMKIAPRSIVFAVLKGFKATACA